MSTDGRRKAIETAMRRRAGASPERAAAISRGVLGADDLRATCKTCGEHLFGTLATIKAHVCAGGSE